MTGLKDLVKHAFRPEKLFLEQWIDQGPDKVYAKRLYQDLDYIFDFLGMGDMLTDCLDYFPPLPIILCTSQTECIICPPEDGPRVLRRNQRSQKVILVCSNLTSTTAYLFIAHCLICCSNYYPDHITYRSESGNRMQKLEYGCKYLRVSKHGVWVDRKVADLQEKSVLIYQAGWANTALWMTSVSGEAVMTSQRVQHLFLEHFGQHLIAYHGKENEYQCIAHPNMKIFANSIWNIIGQNGGVIQKQLSHGCYDCTHVKCFWSDLLRDGVNLDPSDNHVAEHDDPPLGTPIHPSSNQSLPIGLPNFLPQQLEPVRDQFPGGSRMLPEGFRNNFRNRQEVSRNG